MAIDILYMTYLEMLIIRRISFPKEFEDVLDCSKYSWNYAYIDVCTFMEKTQKLLKRKQRKKKCKRIYVLGLIGMFNLLIYLIIFLVNWKWVKTLKCGRNCNILRIHEYMCCGIVQISCFCYSFWTIWWSRGLFPNFHQTLRPLIQRTL